MRLRHELPIAILLGAVMALTAGGCLFHPPGPTPGPGPQPGPVPFPADKLHVLLVYETTDATKLTDDQRAILFGSDVREFLKQTCPEGPDGKTDTFRIYDDDTDVTAEAEVWQKAMAVKRESLPWLVLSNGTAGFNGPLTMTADEFKAIVQKHVRK